MRGKCECGRYGELRGGQCYVCNPPTRSIQKQFEKNFQRFKNSPAFHRVNLKFKPPEKKKRGRIPKPKKPKIRQIDVMKEKWEETEHVSFINGEILRDFSPMKMAHVLPKGSYPRWKNKKFNLVLMTEGQHWQQHNMPQSVLEELHPGWIRFFKLQDRYRAIYNEGGVPLPYPEKFPK